MWHSATVTAYDILDRVHINASVRMLDDDPSKPMETVLTVTTTVPSSGETDHAEWLREALVALLEVT